MSLILRRPALAALLCVASLHAAATAAKGNPFFNAALCKPPYTTDSATKVYNAAEKIAKFETVGMMAVSKMPQPIRQEGFETSEVVFSGNSVGVVISGDQAGALAAKYQLTPEARNPFRGNTTGYARTLPAAQQPNKQTGSVSIVARESAALPGKTFLVCEFVSHEDAKALKELAEKYGGGSR